MREQCLHLKASTGIYTNLNGEFRRVPLGAFKIGLIAQGQGPIFTDDVLNDDQLPNKAWLQENNLRSFPGYPLIYQQHTTLFVNRIAQKPQSKMEKLGIVREIVYD